MDHHLIKNQQTNGFPILPIALLCILATAFLLITYYFFATKCRLRRLRPPSSADHPSSSAYSTPPWQPRGLNESLIREIPIIQYTQKEAENRGLYKCVVCLNDFQQNESLRILHKCSHGFHLDCIDIWLQTNTNCPLCRLNISGTTRYPTDRIIAPTSSPQDPNPFAPNQDFLIIDLSQHQNGSSGQSQSQTRLETRKSHPLSIMGDESIDIREKDEQFSIQPIRRSFSMDSAIDLFQEVIQQNESSSSSRTRRPFFSFGHGRGSRSAILPIEF